MHLIETDEYSTYIIDWMMPDMNGVETARRIRRVIGENKTIIILTAYDWSDIEEEAKEAGVKRHSVPNRCLCLNCGKY